MYQLISTLPHTSVLTNTHGVVNWWSHTTITHTLPDTAMETSRHTHHTTSTSVCWCGPRGTRWSTTSWVMYSKKNTVSDGYQMTWANSKYHSKTILLLQLFVSDQRVLMYIKLSVTLSMIQVILTQSSQFVQVWVVHVFQCNCTVLNTSPSYNQMQHCS